ncbi:MAG: hypothetical protein ABF966_08695 [Bifidobacterium psychraerophilum]|uniref:hypothetical protein n=1 Tax=Bifidobacterium psychraerophilum TaxID=218140 RepID=UPI0039EB3848
MMSASHRKVTPWLVLLLLISVLVCATGAYLLWSQMRLDDAQPKDLQGNIVALEDGDLSTGNELKQMNVVSDTGIHLTVPSVGLDVPVGSLSEVNGQITPPGFTSAYIVRNRGAGNLQEASKHTLFVVTHSVNHGQAPGNYLINVADGRPTVAVGEQIHLGTLKYQISGTTTILKSELGGTSSVWEDSPGRLVLITCLQREHGKSLKNVVITAEIDTP